jgi:FtsZ-interacting cell division protein YlmF
MFNFDKFWVGPETYPERSHSQGFDPLFSLDAAYEIPGPNREQRVQLESMKQGDESAMNSIFDKSRKNHETSFARTPLQAVQAGSNTVNIVVVEPRSFDDSVEIVKHLKGRKSVIVNLQYLDNDVSQRVIDFVSGATFAMDGTQERVGHGVFIFASMNCNVETDSQSSKAYKDLFAKTFGI